MSSRKDVTFEMLPTINRHLVLIEPTTVFLDWARKFPSVDQALTLEELLEDNTTYLIPENEENPDAWLKRNYKIIFDVELDGWCTDPSLWPKVRSFKAFKTFFKVRFSSLIIDLGTGSIDREYL